MTSRTAASATMRALDHLINTEPNRATVTLEFWGITSLEPLLPLLSQLRNLGTLSLANNSMAELPSDLAALESLTKLDLTNNPLRNLSSVLASLATLPSLAVLKIDLDPDARRADNERRRVCKALPFLQILNDAPTSTDATDEAELHLEDAATRGNNARVGDTGAGVGGNRDGGGGGGPQEGEEEDEDEEGGGEEAAAEEGHEEAGGVRQEDSLGAAAGGATTTGNNNNNNNNTQSDEVLIEAAIARAATVFDAVESLLQSEQAEAEQVFDQHVKQTLRTLAARKQRAANNAAIASVHSRVAHRALLDICEARLLQHAASLQDPSLEQALRLLFGAQADLAAASAAAQVELAKQADRSERELTQVLATAEMLEQQVDVETMKNKILSEAFDKERERLQRRLARATAAASGSGARPTQQSAAPELSSMSLSVLSGGSTARATAGGVSVRGRDFGGAGGGSPPSAAAAAAAGAAAAADAARDMTLKQLLDLIEAVYESKTEFDRKCEEARQPKETMHQHLLTYLRKQYGLPSLLESHAVSITRATNFFAERNNDVMVFKKILNHEFEEDFRQVQASLKKSVKSLLRAYLRDSHKRKSVAWVDSLLKKRTTRTGLIYEKEWTDILKYMYNVEDAMNLTCMLKEMVDQQEADAARNAKPVRGQPRALVAQQLGGGAAGAGGGGVGAAAGAAEGDTRYAVRYLDFEQVLLNFQLKGHEQFLRQFCQVFRQFDPHGQGLLDEKQLRLLVLKINPNKTHHDLDRLVAAVDPYNNQLITFSQVVNVLQDEIEILASGLHPNFPSSQYN